MDALLADYRSPSARQLRDRSSSYISGLAVLSCRRNTHGWLPRPSRRQRPASAACLHKPQLQLVAAAHLVAPSSWLPTWLPQQTSFPAALPSPNQFPGRCRSPDRPHQQTPPAGPPLLLSESRHDRFPSFRRGILSYGSCFRRLHTLLTSPR